MPKREEDKPVSLHPLTFEQAIQLAMKTPPVNPAKRKQRTRKKRAKR